jgi:hypothetical protein
LSSRAVIVGTEITRVRAAPRFVRARPTVSDSPSKLHHGTSRISLGRNPRCPPSTMITRARPWKCAISVSNSTGASGRTSSRGAAGTFRRARAALPGTCPCSTATCRMPERRVIASRDAAELGRYIDERLTRSAFRLELLDSYEVKDDGDDFARYLRGEPDPTPERKQPWLDRLRREHDAGILNQRVHVLSTPLTDSLRYECEWGYQPNADAGEDIRIVDLTEHPAPHGIVDHDFWLIDDRHAIRMHL